MSLSATQAPAPLAGRAVLFDLDGTISDPKAGLVDCLNFALRELGLPEQPAESLGWVVGPPLAESFVRLAGPEKAPQALALYRSRYGETGLFQNQLYPGVEAAAAALQAAGARLYVATAKLEPFARRIVDHFGLSRYFVQVYGSQPDGAFARKDALIERILRLERLAGPAVMIGDREYDCLGARANGLKSIGVLWGYGARAELERAGCDALADAPGDLPALVASLLGRPRPGADQAQHPAP